MKFKYKKNYFGIQYPPDWDSRWQRLPQQIDPVWAHGVLPIGMVIHPSGWAQMQNMDVWNQIEAERAEKTRLFYEQRTQEEKERERQIKEQQKQLQIQQQQLKVQQQQLQTQLNQLQKNYERDIRQLTRPIDTQYNPQINNLQKQLKKINKQIQ
tara:strand:- start:456 stop:917 length:462 start_codon:yes stop_codon:yes gene_type:complete